MNAMAEKNLSAESDVVLFLDHLFQQVQHARLMCLFMRHQATSAFGSSPMVTMDRDAAIQRFTELIQSQPQPPPRGIIGLPNAAPAQNDLLLHAVQTMQWETQNADVFNSPANVSSQELTQIERQIDMLAQSIATMRLRLKNEAREQTG